MKSANFSWPGWGIITVSLGILGWLLPHSAWSLGLWGLFFFIIQGRMISYGLPTAWQIRHPRQAWWMAHTGKRVLADESKYESELHQSIVEASKSSMSAVEAGALVEDEDYEQNYDSPSVSGQVVYSTYGRVVSTSYQGTNQDDLYQSLASTWYVLTHSEPRYASLRVLSHGVGKHGVDTWWFVRDYTEAFLGLQGEHDYLALVVNRGLQRYAEACLEAGVAVVGAPEMRSCIDHIGITITITFRANVERV